MGDALFEETYLDEVSFSDGRGKYYEEGLWICLALDRLSPDWQTDFTVDDLYRTLEDAVNQILKHS